MALEKTVGNALTMMLCLQFFRVTLIFPTVTMDEMTSTFNIPPIPLVAVDNRSVSFVSAEEDEDTALPFPSSS